MPDRPTRPKPKPKPPKPVSRDYFFEGLHVYCFQSKYSKCTTTVQLWEGRRSNFHDSDLQEATQEINTILSRVERGNDDSSRRLSFINFQGRWMLVWTRRKEIISSDDEEAEIAKVLKLKRFHQS